MHIMGPEVIMQVYIWGCHDEAHRIDVVFLPNLRAYT